MPKNAKAEPEPRKARKTRENTADTATAETEQLQAQDTPFIPREGESTRAARRRLSLPLNEEGSIDWEGMRESTRADVLKAVTTDTRVISATNPSVAATGLIQESHVSFFLDTFSWIERMIAPKLIEKNAKQIGLPDGFKLSPGIVAQAFIISDENKKKLTPAGAAHFNAILPEGVKLWIAKVGGPGTEFWGGLAMLVTAQMQTAVAAELALRANIAGVAVGTPEGVHVIQQEEATKAN